MVSVSLEAEQLLARADGGAALAEAAWRVLHAAFDARQPPVVAAHTPAAIGRLRNALYCLPRPPKVIVPRELRPD